MFKVKKVGKYFIFIMKKYKLVVDGNEYLVSIVETYKNYVTTKDCNNIYRNVKKEQLIEV